MCSNLSKTDCKNMVNSILFRLERKEWWNEVMNKSKLRTYQKFKSEYISEAYINLITCRAHRSFLAKLRGGLPLLR